MDFIFIGRELPWAGDGQQTTTLSVDFGIANTTGSPLFTSIIGKFIIPITSQSTLDDREIYITEDRITNPPGPTTNLGVPILKKDIATGTDLLTDLERTISISPTYSVMIYDVTFVSPTPTEFQVEWGFEDMNDWVHTTSYSDVRKIQSIRLGENWTGNWKFDNALSLTSVFGVLSSTTTNLADSFKGCVNLRYIDFSNWDVTNITGWQDFMNGSPGTTTDIYTAALIYWATLTLPTLNVSYTAPDFGGSQYRVEAASAKATVEAMWGQTIIDGGCVDCPVTTFFDTYDPSQTACSLRQLDNDSTECLVVRRDSDNATQSIGFVSGLIDTDSMETFCGTYSGYVETWFGQGPSASNYVQTTTSKQPQIVDAGSTILINTKPALHFGYTGSVYMESTKTLSSRFTLFSVAELGSTASNASLYRGSSGGGVIAEYRNDLSNFNVRYNGVANYTATGGWDTNQNLIEVLTDSSFTNTIVYKNGTSILNTPTGTPIATSGTTAIMGALSTTDVTNWNGHIQEMIIYDTYTTTDRSSIETDINDYWGIY